MTYDQLYGGSFRELWNRLEGWKEQEDAKEVEAWRRQRWHVFFMLRMMSKKPHKPEDLLPLPGDKKDNDLPESSMSHEEREKTLKRWEKIPFGIGRKLSAKDFK